MGERLVYVLCISETDPPGRSMRLADGVWLKYGETGFLPLADFIFAWQSGQVELAGLLGPDIPDMIYRSITADQEIPGHPNRLGPLIDRAYRLTGAADSGRRKAVAELERAAALYEALLVANGSSHSIKREMQLLRIILQEHEEGKHRGQAQQ